MNSQKKNIRSEKQSWWHQKYIIERIEIAYYDRYDFLDA